MDAGLMTWYAKDWVNVPFMSTCYSSKITSDLLIPYYSGVSSELQMDSQCKSSNRSNEVNYIEQVQVFVTLSAERRGDIELYLISPSNTMTQLLFVCIFF